LVGKGKGKVFRGFDGSLEITEAARRRIPTWVEPSGKGTRNRGGDISSQRKGRDGILRGGVDRFDEVWKSKGISHDCVLKKGLGFIRKPKQT